MRFHLINFLFRGYSSEYVNIYGVQSWQIILIHLVDRWLDWIIFHSEQVNIEHWRLKTQVLYSRALRILDLSIFKSLMKKHNILLLNYCRDSDLLNRKYGLLRFIEICRFSIFGNTKHSIESDLLRWTHLAKD